MDKVNTWLDSEKKKAAAAGINIFMGIPDTWFEPQVTFCCENGHVSHRFLKSEERGDLCLACFKSVRICPPDTNEEQLKSILKEETT